MRAFIEVDAKKLEKNYLMIKKAVDKDIIAVIKSNAYGHGLLECAFILANHSPKMFAVATLDEAINIRKNLIFTPILLLAECVDAHTCYNFKITLSVISMEHLQTLAALKTPLMIHLLIDTGMNRDGLITNEIDEALAIIKKSNLILKGVFTHFSSPKQYKKQNEIFEEALLKFNTTKLIIHSQASSTMLVNSEKTNAIRIGLALYGLSDCNLNIEPVLTLKAPITRIKKVKKGDSVGYEESEVCPSDGYILTLGIGYADGLQRNRHYIGHIDQQFIRQIGYTCMDHIMMFTQEFPIAKYVELLGKNINIVKLAEVYKTIPYEIVAHLASRLKRHLLR